MILRLYFERTIIARDTCQRPSSTSHGLDGYGIVVEIRTECEIGERRRAAGQ
jgi:hypothetical protein